MAAGKQEFALVMAFASPPGAAVEAQMRAWLQACYGAELCRQPNGHALEARVSAPDAERLWDEALANAALWEADTGLLPVDRRVKALLVSDMDSTVIEQECIDEMADMLGIKPQIAAITERAMRGELDFEAALAERVALLKGLPEEDLLRVWKERIRFTPGAKELIAGMKAAGAVTVLVSGGFTFFTERVACELGFDHHQGNVLEVADGRLTGRVRPPILGADAKLAALMHWCGALGISPEDSMVLGDGANDLPMLTASGMGVAYRAKPKVQEACRFRINHTDLRAALWMQGIG